GHEHVPDGRIAELPALEEYCRQIETYLCRRNDGHLIRVVGPSFDRVSGWSEQGIPLKVACRGIDRYFERYYRKGPRRRPVRIDFCEADVLEAFDDWRRALGIVAGPSADDSRDTEQEQSAVNPQSALCNQRSARRSLPAHLDRVL